MGKKYYYIGVQTEKGMAFVTSIVRNQQMAFWILSEKPMSMSHQTARDYAEALRINGTQAVIVESFCEITEHFTAKN